MKIAILAVTVLALFALPATADATLEFQGLHTVPHGESEQEYVAMPSTLDAAATEANPIKMSIGTWSITCKSASATASLPTGSSPTVALAPANTTCSAPLFSIAEFANKGCSFTLHGLKEASSDAFNAQADVACSAGGEFLVTVRNFFTFKTLCQVHIYAQKNLEPVKVTDMTEASPPNFTVESSIEKMQAVVTKGEEACPVTPGTYSNVKYTGTTAVSSTDPTGETPPSKGKSRVANVVKFHFAWDPEDVTLAGQGEKFTEFEFDIGRVGCETAAWSSSYQGKTKKLPFLSTTSGGYDGCIFAPTLADAEVDLNGCTWTLYAKQVEDGNREGAMNMFCGLGIQAEVKVPACAVTIRTQLGIQKTGDLRRVTFEEIAGAGGKSEITAKLNIAGIEYEEVGKGCIHPDEKTSNGTLKGNMKFIAKDNADMGKQANLSLVLTNTTP